MTTAVAGSPEIEFAIATPDQPIAASERLVSLDLIRGVAVLGILFANITAFGHPDAAYFWPVSLPGGASAGDKLVWFVQLVLVDHKFRALFSLLFGAGIYLFMERAWARGSTRWLQFQRLCWLLVFGAIHYFLIWHGDILGTYAAAGMMALPLLKWPAARQLKAGIIIYTLGALFMLAALGSALLGATNATIAARMPTNMQEKITNAPREIHEGVAKNIEFMQSASYPEVVARQVTEHAGGFLQSLIFVPLTETLGLVLIGMALYRRGFFSGAIDPARMRRGGWIAFLGGLAYTALVAIWPLATGFPLFTTIFAFNELARIAQIPVGLGLAAILVADAPRLAQTALGSRLAAAGRMAFTNYLGTSILMMFVFHGWALGLFGKLHRVELMLIVFAVWVAMLLWSKPWLARYRYGPLEWLWRCLTYWKVFPLKR